MIKTIPKKKQHTANSTPHPSPVCNKLSSQKCTCVLESKSLPLKKPQTDGYYLFFFWSQHLKILNLVDI